MSRISRALIASLFGVAAAAPHSAPAQPAPSVYKPPSLATAGKATTPITGPGKVLVQVLVHTNGTFQVIKVIKSTNHGDDAAALEVARTSKYRPAIRGAKAVEGFYDYELNFTSSGNVASGPPVSGNKSVDAAERMLRANQFSQASSALTAFVATHPTDVRAQVDLGVAEELSGNPTEAVAAFDRGGNVPQIYRAVAGKAYADYATVEIKAKDLQLALPAAKKAVSFSPTYANYDILAFAEYSGGDYPGSVNDFEKARSLAASGNAPGHDRVQIDISLITAYLSADNVDQAKAIADEAGQLDPGEAQHAQTTIANYDIKRAQTEAAAGRTDAAATILEKSADTLPKESATLWSWAAIMYLKAKPTPEAGKAKADADKALAIDPNSALANYAVGVALANQGNRKDALVYLNKADAAAKSSGDTETATQAESAINTLNGSH